MIVASMDQMVSPSINYKGSMERKRSFGHRSLRCVWTNVNFLTKRESTPQMISRHFTERLGLGGSSLLPTILNKML